MIIHHDFGLESDNILLQAIETSKQHRFDGDRMTPSLMVGFGTFDGLLACGGCPDNATVLSARDFIAMHSIDLAQLGPRLVLTPLMSGGYDVLDFAGKLADLGFQGRYRAVVWSLPDAKMVVREIRKSVPSINFGVTETCGMEPFLQARP